MIMRRDLILYFVSIESCFKNFNCRDGIIMEYISHYAKIIFIII